jgi:hypothetical protein
MFKRLLNPSHVAFWTLLASVATVVGLAITIVLLFTSGSSGQAQQSNLSAAQSATGSPTAGSAATATTSTTTPSAGTSGAGTDSPSTAGKVYLSTLKPVASPYANVDAAPVQFGTTTYPQSIRFTCEGGQSSVTYQVAGYAFLDATVGVPDDATNATGHTAKVTFLKNGTSTPLGQPLTVVLGRPQQIHLDLQGSAQVAISCVATDSTGGYQSIDIALGDAALVPS